VYEVWSKVGLRMLRRRRKMDNIVIIVVGNRDRLVKVNVGIVCSLAS